MANSVDPQASPTVVVLGNPNAGKSTLFNGLTGVKQHVGNYPGVTVAKRSGSFEADGQTFELVDLPGTYSLAPNSPEEMLSVKILLGKLPAKTKPDVILCVVDASNLQRNLFLVSQVLELHQPTVVAVNMIDVAAREGIKVDCEKLQEILGVSVVPIQAKRRQGFEELKQAIAEAKDQSPKFRHDPFEASLKERIERLESTCPDDCALKRFTVTRMLFDADGFMSDQLKSEVGSNTIESMAAEKSELQSSEIAAFESESSARYAWISRHFDSFTNQSGTEREATTTDRLDAWLTHPVFGLLVAAVVLVLLFQVVFWIATPASDLIDVFNNSLASVVNAVVPKGTLNSLLVDGLINGVGSVLIFLPQILLLFFILGVLEDSGYLARAAFLMDRFLSKIGLSGVTLFPLLSSFACAIPGIMATRVIKDDRERLITILIAPLMSCSARLPVYVLLIATFVPQSYLFGFIGVQGLTMLAMYLVGIIVAVLVALVLRKTMIKSPPTSFVLELPTYKMPSFRNIWQRMFEGGWSFIRDAGTTIVVVTILVWAAGYFPRLDASNPPAQLAAEFATVERLEPVVEAAGDSPDEMMTEELSQAQNTIAAFHLRQSYLGRGGKLIEPIVKPLGWDWRIGSATIASFPAREVIVSTMGVIFGLGEVEEEDLPSLRQKLAAATWDGSDRPLFTIPVALSVMVFFALCAQCVSTLAVIKRETNTWRWPIFSFVYMTILAYVGAWATYQLSSVFFDVA
ncbi:ferrous iron transport protein B [Mariniblastus sp.]|nr:ferrous iron transport protein B [Mariniblastus sp.]